MCKALPNNYSLTKCTDGMSMLTLKGLTTMNAEMIALVRYLDFRCNVQPHDSYLAV